MRQLKILSATLGAALLVAACGGGDDLASVPFTSMVSFGDSLSDVGSYRVGAVAASGGGRYTVNPTNPATATNWTELLAAQLGQKAPCAAQTGLTPTVSGPSNPAVAPVNHPGCLNYAQGGARVTNPVGPGNSLLGSPSNQLGQLTVPVVTQISNHLARSGGSFSGTELVTVMAGANDVFINLATIAPTIGSLVANGADAAAATNTASTAAVTAMGTAGAELAAYIRTQIVAKGANYIAVVNLPDVSKTPFAYTQDASTQGLINTMVTTFNAQLKSGLAGAAGVVLVDAYTDGRLQAANPASYGISNAVGVACNLASPVPNAFGSSLVCNASNLNAGDVSRFLFADSVHPTPYGHYLLSQLVGKNLVVAGWMLPSAL